MSNRDHLPETYGETARTDTTTDETTNDTESMTDTETSYDDSTDTASSPAMRGPNEYDPIDLYDRQRHRNGDETVVLLTEFGGGYQAIAIEVDGGGQVLETEIIGDSPDHDKAVGMCEYWINQNPKGILGGEPDDDSGGFLEALGFGGGEA